MLSHLESTSTMWSLYSFSLANHWSGSGLLVCPPPDRCSSSRDRERIARLETIFSGSSSHSSGWFRSPAGLLSAGLRFFSGTHLSIETSVSVPPWPAHHCCMLSPRKETVQDFTLQEAPLTASTGGTKRVGASSRGAERGVFWAVPLSSPLLCLLCLLCWRRLLTTLPTPASRLLLLL